MEIFTTVASSNATFYADLTNPQSLNKYQYCLGNPLRYLDPYGHQSQDSSGGITEWFRALVRRFVAEINPEQAAINTEEDGGRANQLSGYSDGDKVIERYTEIAGQEMDIHLRAMSLIDPTGGVAVMHDLAKGNNTGAIISGVGMVGMAFPKGPAGELEKRAFEQLEKRFLVTLGKDVSESAKMADFLAVAKSGNSAVIMEASTGSKTISTLKAQLSAGYDWAVSQGFRGDRIKLYFRTTNRQLADQVRRELPKLRGRVVNVILD